jgi:hypothetical protein
MFGCEIWPSWHEAYDGVRSGGFIYEILDSSVPSGRSSESKPRTLIHQDEMMMSCSDVKSGRPGMRPTTVLAGVPQLLVRPSRHEAGDVEVLR